MNNPQSLRTQLLAKLTLPLMLVLILDAIGSYFVALHYANLAYDRWLLDSAKSLSQEIKTQQNHVTFDLPPIAAEVFRWDEIDKTFFKVESEQEGFIAGDRQLPSPDFPAFNQQEVLFKNSKINGQSVRIVSVLNLPPHQNQTVIVSVAETMNKRQNMMHEMLLADLIPQSIFVIICFSYFWTGIDRGLKPLRHLGRLIAKRSAKDFSPIGERNVPLEVLSLIHTINDLLERLGSTLMTQQRFIENAAHQLRTPLAGLKLQAERALVTDNPNTMKEAMTQIKNAADRISHLNQQLLVLAKSEAIAQTSTDFSLINLGNLVREACLQWITLALDRQMELDFQTAKTPVLIHGDPILIQELLNNLLDNAIAYGHLGGHISIKVDYDTCPYLTIEDNGKGIPVQEQQMIFERFYRIQGSSGEGCGLGLAIVKEIADLHKAEIKLESQLASLKGTRITISFNK